MNDTTVTPDEATPLLDMLAALGESIAAALDALADLAQPEATR